MSDAPDAHLDLEPEDSPCQLVCSMDKESGHCFGCGRTQDEIAYWTLKTQDERTQLLVELEDRMPPLRIKLAERRAKRRVNRRARPASREVSSDIPSGSSE